MTRRPRTCGGQAERRADGRGEVTTRRERPALQASWVSASVASDSTTPSITRSMWSMALTTSASERRRRSSLVSASVTCVAWCRSSSS